MKRLFSMCFNAGSKSGNAYNPELNPPLEVQGSLNEDCVAEWFFCLNWNTSSSPGLASYIEKKPESTTIFSRYA